MAGSARGFRVAFAVLGLALGMLLHSATALAGKRLQKDDPRSGAALNRLQTKDPFGSPPAALAAGGPGAFIHGTFVNDPTVDATAQDTQSETSLTLQGATKVVTAFNDSGSFSGANTSFTGYSSSTNSGNTWTDGGTLPSGSLGDAGDPVLATIKDTGVILMTTLKWDGEGLTLLRSTDGGATFGSPINVVPSEAGTGDFLDKAWIAVNNQPGAFHDNVAVCYTNFAADGSEKIFVAESVDGGASFFAPVLVNDGGQGCNVTWGFDPTGGGNTLYATYYQGSGGGGQGGDNKLFMNTYNETGVGPRQPTVTRGGPRNAPAKLHVQVADLNTTSINGDLTLKGGLRSNSFPQTVVNPKNGNVFVVYNDDPDTNPANGDNSNVFYVRSTDGGATWGAPVTANDDTAGDQFFPSMAITNQGSFIGFSYYSRANDPANLMFHRRGRHGTILSTGVPSPWASYQLSPDTPVAIGQDPVINSTYMGDYDQTVATGTAFYSSWSDNRAGNTFHQFQPDVHFARISPTSSTSDVQVSVAASPSTVPVGTHSTVTVTTTTVGAARDVYVRVNPVGGLRFKSTSGASCKTVNGFVSCRLGDIPNGATRTFTIDTIGLTPAGARVVKALATQSTNDPTPANNMASATITTTGTGVTTLYSTGDIAVPIADLSTAEVPLAVPDVGSVLKVRARVRLDHTFDSDLAISLIDPDGTVVALSTHNGGSGDNYGSGANSCSGTPTVFDGSAATSIVAGAAPFAGTFKPQASLSAMGGDSTGGTWKLRVSDTAGADTGTIGCFRLQITHP